MVKQAAHDSLDECSKHSGLNITVFVNIRIRTVYNPSAGIGRQDNLKIY